MTKRHQAGFTLVETIISIGIISLITVGLASLFLSLISSTILSKQRATATALATNQIEYLKSLSYDNLAVQGGSIIASSYIPASFEKTLNGVKYRIETAVSYADDAYDGCGNYPNIDLKKKYCRNYPPPANSPAIDTNPADYKLAMVIVKNSSNARLATFDTQISARVSETASMTGALFITVADPSGTGVSDATVTITNNTIFPAVNASDVTDSNGTAIFYGLPPDNQQDYVVSVTKNNYSSLATIPPNGSLLPTYGNQKIIAQQASYITMLIAPMRPRSLIIETTDTSGNTIDGVKIYVRGGYKKYTLATNESYYYDTLQPTDTGPTTDSSGLSALNNLPPVNSYFFCGTNGGQNCSKNSSALYLAAALPYGGNNSLYPISIPIDSTGAPNAYPYEGNLYAQKVRLMLTTNASLPRIFSVSPDTINLSDNLQNVKITLTGYNLSSATVTLSQGSTTYSDTTCPGSTTQITCNFNLQTITQGELEISVSNSAGTLTLPLNPKGGIYVKP